MEPDTTYRSLTIRNHQALLLRAGMRYPAPQIGNHLDTGPTDAPDEHETPGFAYGDISHINHCNWDTLVNPIYTWSDYYLEYSPCILPPSGDIHVLSVDTRIHWLRRRRTVFHEAWESEYPASWLLMVALSALLRILIPFLS
jgi:hypothetical protein